MLIVPLLLFAGLAGAGCAGDTARDNTASERPGAPGTQADALPGGRNFVVTAVTAGGQARSLVTGTSIRLEFRDASRLSVQAGCNEGSGTGRLMGGKLVIEEFGITDKGCDQSLHQQDDWIMGFFRASPNWKLDGSSLKLTTNDMEMTLSDAAAAPTRELVGTRWTVDTVVSAGVSSAAPSGATAYLTFEPDGVVKGNTGCNTFGGKATIEGDKITFGDIAMTRKGCDGALGALEADVVKVMEGTVTYKIDGSRLILDGAGGNGLRLAG
jgi:heat shock protein HslJ